jgi:hypothetical protein
MNRGIEMRTLHLIVPLRYVLNLGTIAQVNMRTLWKKTITVERCTSDTMILSRGSANAYSTLWWPTSVEDCTQPLSSDPKIKLEYHGFLPYLKFSLCEESPQFGVSHPYKIDLKWIQEYGGNRITHTRDKLTATHKDKIMEKSTKQHTEVTAQNKCPNLNLLKQRREFDVSALLDVQWLLGVVLHAHRGPFYSPKGARSRWSSIWKALVVLCPLVQWTVWGTPDSEQCACWARQRIPWLANFLFWGH